MMVPIVLCALAAPAACLAVEGDRIRAADLARAAPAFAALPPETELGYAPAPGARRLFRPSELKRLAARHGVRLESAAEACFTVPVAELPAGALLEAMRRSLAVSGARIEIVDYSRHPAPAGTLEFPLSGLGRPAGPAGPQTVLWKGYVRRGERRRFRIWARVRLTAPSQCAVAAETLPAGRPVERPQVRIEACDGFPSHPAQSVSVEDFVGRLPRRTFPRGALLRREDTDPPKAVARGEAVAVEARYGAAKVRFEGQAESAGAVGDVISVRNPASGRSFKASVKRAGVVVVPAGPAKE